MCTRCGIELGANYIDCLLIAYTVVVIVVTVVVAAVVLGLGSWGSGWHRNCSGWLCLWWLGGVYVSFSIYICRYDMP